MKTIRTVSNQTVFDLAVKYYGTCEAVAELIGNNPGLRNDPAALATLGIDYVADGGFYADAALLAGQEVRIDNDSRTLRQMVVKELQNKEINTFGL
ncbi:hypothetical protein [Rikenella microfusus]|uniref:LysM domain-containing protein n=1 Tax=Rikenella microfusus TaxID=28139 RepID=A0A379MS02_9BACT|nr:hypothetical protein [Rikenella microfusus]SUE33680.1 Uncharacterised protein [Rikenella microfusus]